MRTFTLIALAAAFTASEAQRKTICPVTGAVVDFDFAPPSQQVVPVGYERWLDSFIRISDEENGIIPPE